MTKVRYLLISLWIHYLQTGRWRKAGLLALGAVLVLCSCMGAFSLLLTRESPDPQQISAAASLPTRAPDVMSTRYSTRPALVIPTREPRGTPQTTSLLVSPPTRTKAVVRITKVDKRAEFVEIRNEGHRAQNLSGWVLVSDRGQQECPLDGVLRAGETLRVWSMVEDLSKGGYNCGLDDPIWHNLESDPAVLYNAVGEEIDRVQDRP